MKNIFFIVGLVLFTTILKAQTVMCTEEVIDSLESGSPFTVGGIIEWEALGDDNINLPALGMDNTTLLLDGVDAGTGGPINAGYLNSITFDSAGSEGAQSSSSTTCNPSTLIIFEIEASLPVSWSKSTSVKIKEDKLLVTFSTAQEINNSHFLVEHSHDGRIFKLIGKIDGQGNINQETDYEYIHDKPEIGINYYRIKQVDYDGKFSYSNVASIDLESDKIDVYPNPIEDKLTVISPNISNLIGS